MGDTVDPLDDAEMGGAAPDAGDADANDDEIADLQKKVAGLGQAAVEGSAERSCAR